jgi:hypothetical protein
VEYEQNNRVRCCKRFQNIVYDWMKDGYGREKAMAEEIQYMSRNINTQGLDFACPLYRAFFAGFGLDVAFHIPPVSFPFQKFDV